MAAPMNGREHMRFNRDERGISLLEVSIALVIFLIALFAMAKGVVSALSLNKKNRDLMKVSLMCKEKAEQLFSLNYDDSATDTSTLVTNGDNTISFKTTGGSGLAVGGTVAPNPYGPGTPNVITPKYIDYLDADGNVVPAANGIYTRQWRITQNGDVKTIEVSVVGSRQASYQSARVITQKSR